MPARPSWHARVPGILKTVREPGFPALAGREHLEELFGLGRRQTLRFMAKVEGCLEVGKTFLIPREALIVALEKVEASGEVDRAIEHKHRVLAAVNEISNREIARSAEIRVDPTVQRRQPSELPPAIRIVGSGRLEISYQSAEDLLAHVVELVSAATNDFPRFRQLFEEAS